MVYLTAHAQTAIVEACSLEVYWSRGTTVSGKKCHILRINRSNMCGTVHIRDEINARKSVTYQGSANPSYWSTNDSFLMAPRREIRDLLDYRKAVDILVRT